MGNLFSICGCMNIPIEGITPFGGFFVNNFYGTDDNFFVGLLADDYGLSKIKGIYFEKDKIRFEKDYQNREDIINYDFEFNKKKNIWLGNYNGEKSGKGKAICEINSALKGLLFGERVPMTDEEFARRLINNMIDRGMLIKVEDNEIGNNKP